jgi:2-dehydro-3-deoxy-D-gluconate 5-dehydrogenase
LTQPKDLFRLDGKVAVVTGSSRGIGRAIAVAMAEAGADIIALSTKVSDPGNSLRNEVEAAGRRFLPVDADLSDRKAVYAAVDAIGKTGLQVDILVNNAGAIRRGPAASFSDEDWDHVIAVNLTAPFILAREIGKQMLECKHGKIIFTASLLSFQGGLNVVSYTASKSAIAGVTKALANEWAPHGVNVNAIAPGYISTDVTSALRADPAREASIRSRISAGVWGVPEQVAPAAVYLASPASDYVHGEILTVDGGWMAR